MERAYRDAKASGSIIASVELMSDSRNWPQVPYDQLFLKQCQDQQDKPAVIGNGGTLSYQDLERLSREWAYWLLSEGIKKGDKVLVCMERTIELPAVLLGILRAGACYVPADPAFPPDRIAVIIEDSDSVAAITDRTSQNLLPGNNQFIGFIVEDKPLQPEPCSLPAWCPEDLAYLIFTSGSTGRPKGVPITRAAMVNFLLAMAKEPGIDADDRVLALTTISFDISVLELFLPLIAGATIYLVSKRDSLDPQSLSRIINANGLTFMQATPATWRLLYDYGWRPEKHQRLLCGGEAFPLSLAEGLVACAAEVWNMYGPTEATVWSSCHRVTEGNIRNEEIPLGTPLPNIEYLIIDDSDSPCPPGKPGELLISGVALTPGYYGRPELNKERFVSIGDGVNTRVFYRTGDLVRVNSHDELIYIDRLDNQVKIRGFRVELGEIEASLSRVVHFGDSAVIVAKPGGGELVLVGCIQSGSTASQKEIEEALSRTLPPYMIPGVWRWYSELPKTPNRKIDRKALRRLVEEEYSSQEPTQEGNFTDPLMAVVSRHWQRLLGLAPCQATDDFMAMGGHSLLAARLSVALSEETGRYIRPVELLRHSTLAEHCRLVQEQAGAAPAIKNERREPSGSESIPFSAAQKRMWYTLLSGSSEGIFNESEAYRVEGELDVGRLENAIQRIVDKHVAFRMVVESEQDLTWAVREKVRAPIRKVAVGDGADLSWAMLPDALHQEASRSFRFTREPLIRFVIYTDGAHQHVIQFVAHHLITDGLSETLVWKELADFYQSTEGKMADAPRLDNAYLSYLNSAPVVNNESLEFWVDHLLSPPQVQPLDIKADFPRPARMDYTGHDVFLDLPHDSADSIRSIARDLHSTPFAVFLTTYLLWLNRHSHQQEYIIGTPVSGREPHWEEDMAGLFTNTIPLRLKADTALRFPELLNMVSEVALDAMRHDHIQFDEIVRAINPERDPSRTPIYQVMFALNDYSERPLELAPGAKWTPEPVNIGFSPVDLVLFVDLYPDRLRLHLQANDRLFSYESLERFAKRYERMLTSIARNPDQVCRDIPVLDHAEQRQLMSFSGEIREYPRNATIDECFREHVGKTPEARAVEAPNLSLTYGELSEYADYLARLLFESGIKEGDRVGIAAQRSLETVAGILGVLRAGCVYVPLDLSYPVERLQYIAEKAQIRGVLLTRKQSREMDGFLETVAPVVMSGWSELPQHHGGEFKAAGDVGISAESPAYVMFTSGSTGAPKGIEVSNRNVVRLVVNNNFMALGAKTRFLMYAPVAFDASTLEIWGPLLNGGTLVIPGDDQLSMDQLESVLVARNVNSLWLTAALFHYMAERSPSAFSGLEYLLAGGDVLSPKSVRAVLSDNPALKLINGYGPTENTTFTCCHTMSSPDDVVSPVPIGKPIANTLVYVLDQNGHDCPIGVPGELYAGGDGVALGYIGDKILTAKAFLTNPFGRRIGRVYRTGDKVCWRSDGTLEFLGRYDNQLKIRGFRIEPDEISEVIESYPGVEHAITIGWKAPSGDMQLVSYITPAFESGEESERLQRWLSQKLPQYMLPARLIFLDSFPVGLTGKTDRNRLPDPLLYPMAAGAGERSLPATPTEKVLARIWSRTLGVERVYREDDFFALGGSSIKALEVFGYLAKDLNKDIPLSTLLEHPTLGALARELEKAGAGKNDDTEGSATSGTEWKCLVELGGAGTRHPIVCVHAVGGNVLSYRRVMELVGKGRPLLGFQSRALDGRTAPQGSLNQIANDYVHELLSSGYEAPYTLMGGSLGGTIALEMARILEAEGAEVDWVILLDTIGPNERDISDGNSEVQPFPSRIRRSIKARIAYYARLGVVWSCRLLGFRIPYNLRPFFIEQHHKKLLGEHVDTEYRGNVLLIRGRQGRGGVYEDPYLGWHGVLTGDLRISEIDVSHDVFMESPETIECLRAFFKARARGQ